MKSIRRIVSGKFKTTEIGEVDKLFNELEKNKRNMDDPDKVDDSESVKYYKKADEIYVKLNRLMKIHGLFFREGKDPRRAGLER